MNSPPSVADNHGSCRLGHLEAVVWAALTNVIILTSWSHSRLSRFRVMNDCPCLSEKSNKAIYR